MTRPPVLDPDRFAALVAMALRLGVRELPAVLRRNGEPVGGEMAALTALCSASTGQHRPKVAAEVDPGEGAVVPLAVSFADAARSLDVSERTVRRLVEKGELKAVTIGGRSRRVPVGELSDYLRRQLEDRSA